MKYLHNTTFIVERKATDTFEQWASKVYLPAVRESGRFSSVTMARILADIDPDTQNYAIQMESDSLESSRQWHDDVATLLKDDLRARLNGQAVYFTTDMQIIEA